MPMTKEERLAKIHAEALAEFDKIQQAVRNERLQCLQDRRFYSISGAQWEGPLGEQFENRPRFEFNKTHLAVIRIINEYRNNRITVDFTPKDGTDDKLADVCDGLYRADEHDSGAEEAYDNAFEEAVGGGMGAWRLRARYEDEDDEDNDKQRICIEPIYDADSCVFFDLDAKRQDKRDAKRCWVLHSMTHDAFEDQFGHSPSSWPKEIHQYEFDWCTPDMVYVAEHYRVEETTKVVHVFRGLALGDDEPQELKFKASELDEEKRAQLEATGFREVRRKRIKTRRVHKYILSGRQVEEDEGYIAGKNIPIVVSYGKRWFVDNIERCMGHVRLAKDVQRLINMLMSWLAEMAARFDIEKPILTPEQIQGHATMWARDNIDKFPYLLINPMRDAEGNPMPAAPIGHTKAPNIPPAMAALVQLAEQSLQDLLGNQQAGEEVQPNISGKVVELIQQRLDMQTFIYISNHAKAMRRSGEIWLSMAKDVLVEDGRKMKTVSTDGEPDSVTLREPAYDPKTGEDYLENDLEKANFDVWVDVGPSSSSRRSATVRALTGLAQITQDPETLNVLTAASIMNIEGEGLQELRDFFRDKLVRMGVVKPTKEEAQALAEEQANQPPDPNTQLAQALAEEAVAKGAKARADTVLTVAKAEQARAETAKTLAEIGTEEQNQVLAAVEAVQRASEPPSGADLSG